MCNKINILILKLQQRRESKGNHVFIKKLKLH